MSLYRSFRGGCVLICSVICVLIFFTVTAAFGQDEDQTPKYEIFTGYQWLHPGASVPVSPFNAFNTTGLKLPDMPVGAGASFTYNFTNLVGVTADFGHNTADLANETTVAIGPKIEARHEGAAFFATAMLSYNRLSAIGVGPHNGVGLIAGGGMDLRVNKRFGIRVFEADYVYARQHYGDIVPPGGALRNVDLQGIRLRTGLEWYFGYPQTAAPSASCSVQPSEVMVGEPITATATGSGFNPKHTLTYQWSSNGGKITGNNNTASIDTNGIAGGSYTATATITDPKAKNGTATCSANFTVKEPPKNPPTMSCSASPSTLQAGGSSTITCNCTSPDNVPVTVGDWSSTGGTINGSGNTATLNTTGASAGPITVSATCTDSRGLKSQAATTQVNVENPPPPPAPQASKLSQCDFPNKVKPWRVDNTCKAILDDVAKNLQQNADSKLVIVGNADPTEKRKNLAGERAVDSKYYLTKGEAQLNIDPSRIETRTGSGGTKTAEYWIVPAGATFTGEGTQPVDEMKVKAVPDHPAHPAAKKAAAPKQ